MGLTLQPLSKLIKFIGPTHTAKFLTDPEQVDIHEICEQRTHELLNLVKDFPESVNVDLEWITENPGAQISSSLHPVSVDDQHFYGNCLNHTARNVIDRLALM